MMVSVSFDMEQFNKLKRLAQAQRISIPELATRLLASALQAAPDVVDSGQPTNKDKN